MRSNIWTKKESFEKIHFFQIFEKCEKNQKFDEKFIKLSREVYKTNDERAKIKLRINEILGSNIKEVKSHY